jgi:glycosyltransferase involved in cell wall biosynthesis
MQQDIPVILQILPELGSGGVERGTLEIADAIVQAGGKSLVISAGGRLVPVLEKVGATHITLPVASKNPFTIKNNARKIANIIKEQQVHLVHARSRAPAWSAYLAAKATHIPLVTTFHGTYGLSGLGKKKYNSVMVQGEVVIAVSRHIKDHILQHYEVDSKKIKVIPRGVDIAAMSPERINSNYMADLVQDWHLDDVNAPIIFFPGRVTRWKGQHVVLHALNKLKHRNFVCLFAGTTDKHPNYVRELYQLIDQYRLEKNVRFVSSTQHMAEAYYISDFVVSPSIEPEAFGRVIVEAGAMERIIITTNHGGAKETVKDGRTGFLVAPHDVDSLSQAMDYVLHMPEHKKQHMQHNARTHVGEHFSITNMQNATLDVYEKVLRQWKQP